MKNDYESLLSILKLFKNRPNHLSKFLIESKALNNEFLDKIKESNKLNNIKVKGFSDNHLHFNNISEMKNYYSSLIYDDLDDLKNKKTIDEITIELNSKLREAVEKEDYEEACRIRDYMKINLIKKQ